jgi:hypothetical protein
VSGDFGPMREELVKHLHVCGMCTVAHHALASRSTLGKRRRRGRQSNDQQVRATCKEKPFSHVPLLPLYGWGCNRRSTLRDHKPCEIRPKRRDPAENRGRAGGKFPTPVETCAVGLSRPPISQRRGVPPDSWGWVGS